MGNSEGGLWSLFDDMPPEVRNLPPKERLAKAVQFIADSKKLGHQPPPWATALVGASWSPIASMPPELTILPKAGRLAEAVQLIAESNELGNQPPSWATAFVGVSKGGAATGGKRRASKKELNGEKKAKQSKRNDANKETRSMQQAQRFKCPRKGCIFDCSKGHRMRDMASHLKEFILCRTDESVRDCGICKGAMKKTKK